MQLLMRRGKSDRSGSSPAGGTSTAAAPQRPAPCLRKASKLQDFWDWISMIRPFVTGRLALSVRDMPAGLTVTPSPSTLTPAR